MRDSTSGNLMRAGILLGLLALLLLLAACGAAEPDASAALQAGEAVLLASQGEMRTAGLVYSDQCHAGYQQIAAGLWMHPHMMDFQEAGLDCSDCHLGKMIDPETSHGYSYSSIDCLECHGDPDNAAFGKHLTHLPEQPDSSSCVACHTDPEQIAALSAPPVVAAETGG